MLESIAQRQMHLSRHGGFDYVIAQLPISRQPATL
jgi:hypothetical protein